MMIAWSTWAITIHLWGNSWILIRFLLHFLHVLFGDHFSVIIHLLFQLQKSTSDHSLLVISYKQLNLLYDFLYGPFKYPEESSTPFLSSVLNKVQILIWNLPNTIKVGGGEVSRSIVHKSMVRPKNFDSNCHQHYKSTVDFHYRFSPYRIAITFQRMW